MRPELGSRSEDGRELSMLVWRLAAPMIAASTAPHGGGLGPRRWVVNAQVAAGYRREDPDAHVAELAKWLGLGGPGVGMLTAVDVRAARHRDVDGARVVASVGLGHPTWAASPAAAPAAPTAEPSTAGVGAGTINVVALVPERLSDAALLNALTTVAEAKAQALLEAGVPGTGTASDASCILCPTEGPAHAFGGPRSKWGDRLARAAHAAVRAGCGPVGAP